MQPCAGCGKDVREDLAAFVAPVQGEGFKDFCSHGCLVEYEGSRGTIKSGGVAKRASSHRTSTLVTTKCSVCSKINAIKHEVGFKWYNLISSDIIYYSSQSQVVACFFVMISLTLSVGGSVWRHNRAHDVCKKYVTHTRFYLFIFIYIF